MTKIGKTHRNALPLDYELHWFRIEGVLGYGGFGLTYLACDINLERKVAIKEYMPTQISMREADQSIQPLSNEVEEDYQWGLNRFISEARVLTRFEHPHLVRVFNVFEANNTAYMVMNYESGKSLKEILKSNRAFSEEELIQLVLPLIEGLETVHNQGFVHRDIKPGNIFIRNDGGPVLLDFGSARQTRGVLNTRTLTNFVSPGYAPIEQYTGKSDRQGPWTDIYGLGATLYEVMTGNMPEAAIDRSVMISSGAGDSLIRTALICKGRYSEKFLAAIDHALEFDLQDRPQTMAEWREEFAVDMSHSKAFKILPTESTTFEVDAGTEKPDQPTEAMTRKTDNLPGSADEITRTEILAETATVIPAAPALSRHRSYGLAIGVVGALVLSFIGYHSYLRLSQEAVSPGPLTEEPVIEHIPRPITDVSVIEEMPEPAMEEVVIEQTPEPAQVEVIPAGPTRDELIAELLRQAETDIAALRLTSPEGNNAYDKFMRVLGLDIDNLDAVRGIDRITDRYLQLVYVDIESGNLERAGQYLQKADYLRPGQPKVTEAGEALDRAIRRQDRSKGAFGRIKRLFE